MKHTKKSKRLIVPATKPAGAKVLHDILMAKKSGTTKHKSDRRPSRARQKSLDRRSGGFLLSSVF